MKVVKRKIRSLLHQKFGRWLVIDESPERVKGKICWVCKCDCGIIKVVAGRHLVRGRSRSCGCLKHEVASRVVTARSYKHGMSKSKVYDIWTKMKERCSKNTDKEWHNYGGRGITVCERWQSFENFFADMGDQPPGLVLDRRDNNKGYSKENCRWTTQKVNARNRRDNVCLTFNGLTCCISEWAERLSVSRSVLAKRHRDGMTAEEILTKPVGRGTLLTLPDGQMRYLTDWAQRLGISGTTIRRRLKSGWTVTKAVTTPRIKKGDK